MKNNDIICKCFIHKFRTIENNKEYIFEPINENIVDIENEMDITLYNRGSYLIEDDKYFIIWCNRGHLIVSSDDELEDLIDNGCPFCKTQKTYDWQRHIDYCANINSVGYLIECLPIELGQYKRAEMILQRESAITHMNYYFVPVHVINKKFSDLNVTAIKYHIKSGQECIREDFLQIKDKLWNKIISGKIRDNNLIPILENWQYLLENYKPKETDWFITKCSKCGRINMFSALYLDYTCGKCDSCGDELIPHKKWFGYSYTDYEKKTEKGHYIPEFICINPKYGKKLQDLRPYLNENYIDPADIDCSLLEWCKREENEDIGKIVINQFAKKKNRKKLEDIRADSCDVIWLKSRKGRLFDTTVKSIVVRNQIRESIPGGTSYAELFIFSAMKYYFKNVIHRYRTLDNVEFDIYIPEIRCAIEYNGSVYHKIKYDRAENDNEKQQYCDVQGISLLVIEDDGDSDKVLIDGNKIIFKDTLRMRDKLLYDVCKVISIYLYSGIEDNAEFPSVEEIKKGIRLYY